MLVTYLDVWIRWSMRSNITEIAPLPDWAKNTYFIILERVFVFIIFQHVISFQLLLACECAVGFFQFFLLTNKNQNTIWEINWHSQWKAAVCLDKHHVGDSCWFLQQKTSWMHKSKNILSQIKYLLFDNFPSSSSKFSSHINVQFTYIYLSTFYLHLYD